MRVIAALLLFFSALQARASEARLLFTGDILLAREAAREIQMRGGASPWDDLKSEFAKADFIFGNFEAAVGSQEDCPADGNPCFAVAPPLLALLRDAGFSAVGTSNNHSGDLGSLGRVQTPAALREAGILPIGFSESPLFVRLGGHTVAIVSISAVKGRDGGMQDVPSWQVAQKLRLARALAEWVVVSIHWGVELADWPQPEQQEKAEWLIAQGADLIVGHHPHVVIPPACVHGRPVFYSLGNHVFDQKYPQTKTGLIADCRIVDGKLACGGLATRTPLGSSYPALEGPAALSGLESCSVPAQPTLEVNGYVLRDWTPDDSPSGETLMLEGVGPQGRWHTVARSLLSAETGRLAPGGAPMLFTIERHQSRIDNEYGPRPYVYDVSPQGLIARWRGSALAWPLLDATIITDAAGQGYLCALHRGDSFIELDPEVSTKKPRIAVYVWNGFGFSGVEDRSLVASCEAKYRTVGYVPERIVTPPGISQK